MDKQLAYDWMDGVDHTSLAFRAFVDHMWIHYPAQIRIMIDSFVSAEGKEAFETYLEHVASAENQALCKADEQMGRDRG
jgi:hypothetical protein